MLLGLPVGPLGVPVWMFELPLGVVVEPLGVAGRPDWCIGVPVGVFGFRLNGNRDGLMTNSGVLVVVVADRVSSRMVVWTILLVFDFLWCG